jgi:Bacterial SH3 domain
LLAQPTQAVLTANVAVATLNMREGPGTEFPVVGSVSRATTLTVLSRNVDGTWWYVCCVPGTATAGWASAELLEPVGFDRAQMNDLLAVYGTELEVPTAQPTVSATPAQLPLMFQVSLMPPYAWQGQRAEVILAVANPNRVPIVNAELSDELPDQLAVAGVTAATGGKITQEKVPGGSVLVLVKWPDIGPGKTVTATIGVTVTQALSDGAVIDNLAAVRADNSAYTTSEITIGMPPALLPDFQ